MTTRLARITLTILAILVLVVMPVGCTAPAPASVTIVGTVQDVQRVIGPARNIVTVILTDGTVIDVNFNNYNTLNPKPLIGHTYKFHYWPAQQVLDPIVEVTQS